MNKKIKNKNNLNIKYKKKIENSKIVLKDTLVKNSAEKKKIKNNIKNIIFNFGNIFNNKTNIKLHKVLDINKNYNFKIKILNKLFFMKKKLYYNYIKNVKSSYNKNCFKNNISKKLLNNKKFNYGLLLKKCLKKNININNINSYSVLLKKCLKKNINKNNYNTYNVLLKKCLKKNVNINTNNYNTLLKKCLKKNVNINTNNYDILLKKCLKKNINTGINNYNILLKKCLKKNINTGINNYDILLKKCLKKNINIGTNNHNILLKKCLKKNIDFSNNNVLFKNKLNLANNTIGNNLLKNCLKKNLSKYNKYDECDNKKLNKYLSKYSKKKFVKSNYIKLNKNKYKKKNKIFRLFKIFLKEDSRTFELYKDKKFEKNKLNLNIKVFNWNIYKKEKNVAKFFKYLNSFNYLNIYFKLLKVLLLLKKNVKNCVVFLKKQILFTNKYNYKNFYNKSIIKIKKFKKFKNIKFNSKTDLIKFNEKIDIFKNKFNIINNLNMLNIINFNKNYNKNYNKNNLRKFNDKNNKFKIFYILKYLNKNLLFKNNKFSFNPIYINFLKTNNNRRYIVHDKNFKILESRSVGNMFGVNKKKEIRKKKYYFLLIKFLKNWIAKHILRFVYKKGKTKIYMYRKKFRYTRIFSWKKFKNLKRNRRSNKRGRYYIFKNYRRISNNYKNLNNVFKKFNFLIINIYNKEINIKKNILYFIKEIKKLMYIRHYYEKKKLMITRKKISLLNSNKNKNRKKFNKNKNRNENEKKKEFDKNKIFFSLSLKDKEKNIFELYKNFITHVNFFIQNININKNVNKKYNELENKFKYSISKKNAKIFNSIDKKKNI